jgi:hypothetical protein
LKRGGRLERRGVAEDLVAHAAAARGRRLLSPLGGGGRVGGVHVGLGLLVVFPLLKHLVLEEVL